jgi:DNA-binding transcriptional regulator of glucitol operon
MVVCCALAWWQWERYSSANGTFQNLGYVLQWPLFGLFPAFMFWRIRQLREREAEAGTQAEAENPAPNLRPPQQAPQRPRPEPPVEDDDELAAYNRYLAELNFRDQQTS